MRPFDLEAARRGEPIQAHYDGEWVDAGFVGIHAGMAVVYVEKASAQFAQWGESKLRMAPRKRVVYANVYRTFDTEAEARRIADKSATAIAVPIEIEE